MFGDDEGTRAPVVSDPLPGPERRAWLLAALRELLARAGWEHFVCTPIVLPRAEFFPDRFTRSEAGVRRLIRRLFRYADLELGAAVGLYQGRPPEPRGEVVSTHHEGAAGLFLGIEDEVAQFGVDLALLDDPAGITATLAHETAHAFRTHRGLCEQERDLEEELTDLSTVYLGFGVLNANAALRHRSRMSDDGTFRSQWSVQRIGYLSPQELCFVLAAQVSARGTDPEAIAGCLETNQASWFRTALRWFARERPALVTELGLPPRESWPPPDSVARLTRELGDTDDALEVDAVVQQTPSLPANAGRPVFRVWRRPRSEQFFLGLWIAIGGLLAYVVAGYLPLLRVVVVAITGGGIYLAGRYRRARCSDPDCRAVVARAATVCPGCGGTVSGELQHADERLAAEEALRRRPRA